MDIELARSFLAIISAGSFVRTVDCLHVSQTTVGTTDPAAKPRPPAGRPASPLPVNGQPPPDLGPGPINLILIPAASIGVACFCSLTAAA